AHLDYGELVFPDPATEKLIIPGLGVPEPAWPVGNERDRNGDVFVADVEADLSVAALETVRAVVGRDEALKRRPVRDGISRPHQWIAPRAEDLDQPSLVCGANRPDERVHGVVEGGKALRLAGGQRGGLQSEHER